jgi:hypothetical protein
LKDIGGGGGVAGMGMVNGMAMEAIGDGEDIEPLIGQLCLLHIQLHWPKGSIK